jgi:hypothetical protein
MAALVKLGANLLDVKGVACGEILPRLPQIGQRFIVTDVRFI